ncbi:type II toxin-antitoxin system HipA family toxin [Phytoactinopolyspora mesophila]|uniref:Type II toxin-antitoxin system HipA family toxin n=1 Tax=Phytoactinopolyspora mesophila TaxID=2650750 RepID=A0A7K3M7Y1_9ACTN|nr:type II toxin-antitoxin system HipA family toxin [Phytoactinopolyspora mesophila]NDL59429.1 type II toxin-antitoxin system HipA family toxin [Phytoactinopolyspora mesophila]
MTSKAPDGRTDSAGRAFVWVWLPDTTEPVVAGQLRPDGERLVFNYGQSYLERPDAFPLYLPELPLRRGVIRPPNGMRAAGCVRDAAPDGWGQRVILARRQGTLARGSDTADLPLLTYLLESGSDRVGALDFQNSPSEYKARRNDATLEEVQQATEKFLAGEKFSPDLEEALMRGTSIGGARPKVALCDQLENGQRREMIAKLSVASDPYPVVKAEAVAMDLARRVGLDVATTNLTESLGRDILLVDRFDRPQLSTDQTTGWAGSPGERRMMVSALTILGLDEMTGRWATYHEFADAIRHRFTDPDRTLRELFSRIVFNICVSNTDDHARNHAAFWDGDRLSLTPAYDLCPQLRSGDSAAQAMAIDRNGRRESRFAVCLDAAPIYHLSRTEAQRIIDHHVTVITEQWDDAAESARLTGAEKQQMWRRQILNPSVHYM